MIIFSRYRIKKDLLSSDVDIDHPSVNLTYSFFCSLSSYFFACVSTFSSVAFNFLNVGQCRSHDLFSWCSYLLSDLRTRLPKYISHVWHVAQKNPIKFLIFLGCPCVVCFLGFGNCWFWYYTLTVILVTIFLFLKATF